MIETISDEASISIHVLGNDIGCEHRHRYDVERKAVHRFKSGYINTSCTTYRHVHQHLVVQDVPKTVAFYEQVFGAAKTDETLVNGVSLVQLRLDDSEVWVSGEIVPGLQTHVGLVTEDFDAALEELWMRGVQFMGQPLTIGTQRLVFIRDCNGQQIGITTER
jgi:predicted enzyme related to lactoylglutathione lyase